MKSIHGERAAKVTLAIFFITLVYVSSRHFIVFQWFDYLAFGLALLRGGRMTAFELIFEPFRSIIAKVEKHPHAGDTTEPKYDKGPLKSIGQLVTCVICSAMWWGNILTVVMVIDFNFAWTLIHIMAAVEIAEIAHEGIESLCWGAALSRKRVGENGGRDVQAQDGVEVPELQKRAAIQAGRRLPVPARYTRSPVYRLRHQNR